MKKIYVVRKYVEADNAADALKKEKKVAVDDCYLEEGSMRAYVESFNKTKPSGFGDRKKDA